MKYFASDLCTFFIWFVFQQYLFDSIGVLFQLNWVNSIALRYKVQWGYQERVFYRKGACFNSNKEYKAFFQNQLLNFWGGLVRYGGYHSFCILEI